MVPVAVDEGADSLFSRHPLTPESMDSERSLQARVQQLEAELARSQARVAELEGHWEAWLRLISHDLRGPLTLMLGYTQTVLHNLPDDPTRAHERSHLQAAITAAQRLDKMVSEVVDAARLEARLISLTRSAIDLAAILADQVRKVRRRYPGRTVVSDIPSDLPPVDGDGRQIAQIIATLLSNAMLFSPTDTPIRVSVRSVGGREVTVAVVDQGIGLTEEERRHLFEQFYRPERARQVRREGLGLSLSIAAQLAELHGGRLWAESPGPDRGTTFYLALPIVPDLDLAK